MPHDPAPAAQPPRTYPERVGITFVTGLIGLLPLALTLAVLVWVVRLIHDLFGPLSPFGKALMSIGMPLVACETTAYLIGILGVVLAIYGMGALVENGMGGGWQRMIDHGLRRIPALGTIYDASKHVTSLFDRKKDSLQSMTPVMCFFGDGSDIGTPALMPTSELVHFGGEAYHIVILPTAPVPFGGALLCVKQAWVKPANCSLEDLVGIYVSMGVTAPKSLSKPATPIGPEPAAPLEKS